MPVKARCALLIAILEETATASGFGLRAGIRRLVAVSGVGKVWICREFCCPINDFDGWHKFMHFGLPAGLRRVRGACRLEYNRFKNSCDEMKFRLGDRASEMAPTAC